MPPINTHLADALIRARDSVAPSITDELLSAVLEMEERFQFQTDRSRPRRTLLTMIEHASRGEELMPSAD